jgi:methionyl-tRNA formyltransferase
LRVVFAGTPVFAALALDAILASRQTVVGVLTQPDRPAGRGQKLVSSPVKLRALAAGLPLSQPASLRDPAAQAELRALQPDVIVVAAYGLILPQAVLDLAPLGCLNIHASLLPRWRGAAPIVRAVQAGDPETGISIMKMEAGLDTGPVALTRVTPIRADDTAGSLHDRLAAMGADAIVEALDALGGAGPGSGLRFEPQPETGVTYAHKIDKREARIDWRQDAAALANHLRAFDPQPGAWSALARQPDVALRFFGPDVVREPSMPGPSPEARPAGTLAVPAGPDALSAGAHAVPVSPDALPPAPEAAPAPGRVLAVGTHGLLIKTGNGVLRVAQLQRAGGRRLPVADFIRGHPLQAGELLLPA